MIRHLIATALCGALLLGCGLGGQGVTPVQTPFNKAVYLYQAGALRPAITEYRRALDEDPRDVPARFNLAVALEDLALEQRAAGSPQLADFTRTEARHHYERVLQIQRGHLRATVNLAAMEYEDGQPHLARQLLEAARSEHPHSPLPTFGLAAQALDDGRPADAEPLLVGLVQRDPPYVPAAALLGELRRARGDLAGARDAFHAAHTAAPDDVEPLFGLGSLELAAGRPADATRYLERLLLIDPDHRRGNLALATAYESLGDLEGAVFHLWRARSLGVGDDLSPRLVALYQALLEAERGDPAQ